MNSTGKKELIMDAAMELFAKKGYHNTKMIDIAKNAGIGKGTIYEYFSSKENLFIEIIESTIFSFCQQFDHFDNEDTSNNKLCNYLQFEYNNIKTRGKSFFTIISIIMNSELNKNQSIHNIFQKFHEFRFNIIKEIIEDGITKKEFKQVNPNTAAIAALGAVNFFIALENQHHHPCHLKESLSTEKVDITELVDILLSGLKLDPTLK